MRQIGDKLELPAATAGSPTPSTDEQHEAIRAEIAALASLDLSALRLRWRNETGRRAPPRLPKFLLLRMLAYRMQAAAFGDLDPATEQALKRIARQRRRSKPESSGQKRGKRRRTLKPGTVLVREWDGELHRATVTVDGFSCARRGTAMKNSMRDRRASGRKSRAISFKPPKGVRCAVYTRVSTDHGLEQEFNSLDAQREACEAYVKSQLHEGWTPVKDRFDDGGFSGGSLDRPALHRLLVQIEAREIDTVVVYKVDRLTRSLADFAKLIELFEAHGVSFVSVTQSFNTTTSMGRLTLNVLLSFAQFEREVAGERIRDKVAASKKRGSGSAVSCPSATASKTESWSSTKQNPRPSDGFFAGIWNCPA